MKKFVLLFATMILMTGLVEQAIAQCTVTLNEPDPLEAVISGDATVCAGEPATITVTITGGTATYTVTYDGEDYTSLTSPVTFVVTPTTTLTINTGDLSVTDANSCGVVTFTGSATITVNLFDQYQTRQDGSWHNSDTWEQWNGTAWVNTGTYPRTDDLNGCGSPQATILAGTR